MASPALPRAPGPASWLDGRFAVLERLLDRAFGARANPLRNLGALAFLLFWFLAVSGIYLYIRFDTSAGGALASIDALSRDEPYIGGLLRSIHRYAADAFVVVTLLHLLREFAAGRFRRFRTFSWVSGVPLLWLMYASGVVGYWLVWDARAQYSALATAEWLDALGVAAEPMTRNFVGAAAVVDRLFSLFVFLHLGIPLLLLAGMWIHVQRLGMPRNVVPRALALGTLAMLVAVSLVQPALSEVAWNPLRMPAAIELDWFLLFPHVLMYAWSAQGLWWLAGGFTIALLALPWIARGKKPVPAVVSAQNCNGCGRCVLDCPYQAVLLAPRQDGLAGVIAEMNPARCAACGICAGACPSSTPFRSADNPVSGIEIPEMTLAQARAQLDAALARLRGTSRVIVFGCDAGATAKALEDDGVAALSLRCIAMLPPSFIEFALRGGADGVFVAACREGECAWRLGVDLLQERIAGERVPVLRGTVPRARLCVGHGGAGDEAALATELAAFRASLGALAPLPVRAPKRQAVRTES